MTPPYQQKSTLQLFKEFAVDRSDEEFGDDFSGFRLQYVPDDDQQAFEVRDAVNDAYAYFDSEGELRGWLQTWQTEPIPFDLLVDAAIRRFGNDVEVAFHHGRVYFRDEDENPVQHDWRHGFSNIRNAYRHLLVNGGYAYE